MEACYVVQAAGVFRGEAASISWKAWLSPHGVRCDLNQPLTDMQDVRFRRGDGSSKFRVAHFVDKNKELFEVILGRIGCSVGQDIFPSRLSLSRRNAEAAEAASIKDTFTCSVQALLAILSWFQVSRRCRDQQAHIRRLIHAWVGACMQSSVAEMMRDIENIADECAPVCVDGVVGGRCQHMREAIFALAEVPGDRLPTQIGEILAQLQKLVGSSCVAVLAFYHEAMQHIATDIEGGMLSDKFEVDAKDLNPVRARGTKRKVYDEDWKRAITSEALDKRRTKNGSQLLRGLGDADPHLAQKWEHKEMQAYLASCFRVLKDVKHLGITSDAARLGDPAEECIIFLLWAAEADCGVVAAPQALADSDRADSGRGRVS